MSEINAPEINVAPAAPSSAPGVSASDGTSPAAPVVTATPAPAGTDNSSAPNGDAAGNTGKNWEVEYTTLKRENDIALKRYNDLRRKLDSQGAERNDYKKRFETLEAMQKQIADSIKMLTHKETYDPDQFIEDLRTQGPDYFRNLLQKEREALLAGTNEKISGMEQTLNNVLIDKVVASRLANTAKYPDFKLLEQDMADIYTENTALFDAKYPNLDEKVDALYNAAKLQRSPDAIKEAEARGRKKTEEELAREAHASVAGGGRVGSPAQVDPSTLSAAELKKIFAQKGMVDNG